MTIVLRETVPESGVDSLGFARSNKSGNRRRKKPQQIERNFYSKIFANFLQYSRIEEQNNLGQGANSEP